MKKNALLILGILFIILGTLKSENIPNHFEQGAYLNVIATSGLNMRIEPNGSSLTLKTIPFGAQVKVLSSDYECLETQDIGWVTGTWIKVDFEGDQGYVFDGFLSPLSTPEKKNFVEYEESFIILMHNWVHDNYKSSLAPDTISSETSYTIRTDFGKELRYEQQLYQQGYRSRLFFSNVRVMDIYHLLKGFCNDSDNIEAFENQSLFIKNKNGHLNSIKIYNENYIEIRQLKNGLIRLTINELSSDFGC